MGLCLGSLSFYLEIGFWVWYVDRIENPLVCFGFLLIYMGDLQVENGGEDRLFVGGPPFSLSLSNPDPLSIAADTWAVAEDPTHEILNCIHSTLDSEERRKDVIDYVQRLIRCSVGCEVFPYGSVPLKTYLPDGDIDLTALSTPNVEESLPQEVLAVLREEEQNENAEYEVKGTQFIDAEVKLVKCLVQNIVIDISFNQLGGLCTLCFLEQVDRLVGKDHLFKRSIILIKAWCYYESRILGAHHGLISTYALETLVLYIFHVFNSSLNGPLVVLYRFLDYFSRFDWDNYCISLDGPVCKASLPDIVVEKPENGGKDLMLSEEFLKNCIDMFSVPSRGLETNSRAFVQKHLNIIDPLKENNNLGRSVHRANFYRIRSAFRFGARKLGQILLLPKDDIADEIKLFFKNTLDMHGRTSGPDLEDSSLIFDSKGFGVLSNLSHTETFSEDEMYSKLLNLDFDDDMLVGVEDMGSTEGSSSLSGHRIAADACIDLATFRSLSLRSTNETSDCSLGSSQLSGTHSGRQYNVPHLYFSGSFTENWNLESVKSKPLDSGDGKVGLDSWLEGENHLVDERVSYSDSLISSQEDVNVSDSLSLDFRERGLAGSVGDLESINPLSNLTGDYDSHVRSLLYGQCCHGYALSAPILRTSPPTSPSQIHNTSPPTSPSQFHNTKPWETASQSMPLHQNPCTQPNPNGAVMGPPSYYSTPSNPAFGWEERRKVRGTGTYFPNTNGFCRERASRGRGRNRAPGTNGGQLQRHARNNVWAEANSYSEGSHEFPRAQSPSQHRGKFGLPRQSHHATQDITSHDPTEGNSGHPPGAKSDANGSSNSQRKLAFGSFGPLSEDASHLGASSSSLAALVAQGSELIFGKRQQRVADESFRLKNEDEFPPLS